MLHTVSEREFMGLMREKERYVEERHMDAAHMYASLAEHWASQIAPIRIVILMYITSCTLLRGKSAARISIGEIESAVNASQNSIRAHLKGLVDEGFLIAYRTTAGKNGHEKESRMFEIDCNFVLKASDIAANSPPKLLKFDEKTTSGGLQNLGTPLQNLDPPSYIYSLSNLVAIEDKDRTSVLYSARSSRAVGDKEKPMPVHFPEPKKPRMATARSDSVASVVAAINAAHASRRAGLVRSASTKKASRLTAQEFQALVDSAQADAGLQHRMVVTTKEFGLLRKRFEASPPSDLSEFVSWVLRYWTTIAQQHRAAVRKSEDRKAAGEKGIPAHPDFASLAFRYPYFLKCFANFKAERNIQATEDAASREQKMRDTIQRQQDEIRSLRRATRQRPAPERPPTPRQAAPRTPVRPARATTAAREFDDTDLPEWTAPQPRGARRA